MNHENVLNLMNDYSLRKKLYKLRQQVKESKPNRWRTSSDNHNTVLIKTAGDDHKIDGNISIEMNTLLYDDEQSQSHSDMAQYGLEGIDLNDADVYEKDLQSSNSIAYQQKTLFSGLKIDFKRRFQSGLYFKDWINGFHWSSIWLMLIIFSYYAIECFIYGGYVQVRTEKALSIRNMYVGVAVCEFVFSFIGGILYIYI